MGNRKYKILFFVQSACIIVFVLHYYLKSSVPDGYYEKRSDNESGRRDVRQDRPAYIPADTGLTSNHRMAYQTSAIHGQLSGCTLADVAKRPSVMLLTTTNLAFVDVTLNMFESIRQTGICVNTTVIAEDDRAYRYLRKRAETDPAVHVLMTDSGEASAKKLKWSTSLYNKFVNKRQRYLLAALERGLRVLFSDADTFWFRDPFPYLAADFDVAMLDEKLYLRRHEKSVFCAGFAYYKPSERTLKFVRRWVQELAQNTAGGVADQDVMNRLLLDDEPVHVEVRSLNPGLFPKGGLFYRKGWRQKHNNPVVMHSSHIFGHDNKVKRFKENGMWLLNDTISKTLPTV